MDPLAVETCLQAALTPYFPSGVTIYLGSAYTITQPESLNIVATVEELQHQCGGLYLAEASVRLVGPALYGESVFGSIQAALTAIRTALTSDTFSAGWPSGSPSYGGLFVRTSSNRQSGSEWDIEVMVRLGVQFS